MARRWAMAALLVAACAGDPDTTTTTAGDASTTEAEASTTTEAAAATSAPDEVSDLEPCPTQAGDVLTETMVTNGCLDGEEVILLGVWECSDGRTLWGEGNLWGYAGEPVIETAGDSAADPEYAAAYEECIG